MKIKLDNLDKNDGTVLVMADAAEAEHDQSIEGSRWESDGDFAYAYIDDRVGLVDALEREGYEVDTDDYWEPTQEELEAMWATLGE